MDITQLILDDHHLQRRAFAILDEVDPQDTATLRVLWDDLANFLEVHAAAEEAVFYPELLKLADKSGAETDDAIGDHNDIRDAITEAATHRVGTKVWWAAVLKARKANTEHMGEEEDEGLRDFRLHASLEERHALGVRFAAAKTPPSAARLDESDKNPKEYVEQNR
ncbi:MAG TPA: hemerythrin domain-containing protein [Acidothermaceae bacterium]|jgi:hypothetical protein